MHGINVLGLSCLFIVNILFSKKYIYKNNVFPKDLLKYAKFGMILLTIFKKKQQNYLWSMEKEQKKTKKRHGGPFKRHNN